MAFLLVVIYIAFIGLAIPDSLLGTAWPAIYQEMGLPIPWESILVVVIAAGTVVSSVFSSKVIQKFGTNRVTAYSTLCTALALIGFSFAPNFWILCLCAIPLGLGAGAIDVGLNNYVALHYSASHMSFLHCFYGIGVTVSPFILSLVISGDSGWRWGYRIASGLQLVIALLLFCTLSLWRKATPAQQTESQEQHEALSLRQTLKIPGVKWACLVFIFSCAIEYTCGSWSSTYLVEHKDMPLDLAAQAVMFYYAGMALGRFLSGMLSTRWKPWRIIAVGQGLLACGMVLLVLPGPVWFSVLALFLISLGNGPLVPNFNYLTPTNFGRELSQSVMGTQMAASYLGILLAPVFCGLLGEWLGMGIFRLYLPILFLCLISATIGIRHVLEQKNRL